MPRLVSASVKGYKLDIICKLMEKGITQFEVDTNDIRCDLSLRVKQAIIPEYTQEVAEYFGTLGYVESTEMYMCPRPGNNQHMEAVVVVRFVEGYE